LSPVPLWAAGLAWSEVAASRERNRKRALMERVKLLGAGGLSVEGQAAARAVSVQQGHWRTQWPGETSTMGEG
jgi:hypothetical protein